jgi:Tfp pilus assembly protein FimT
MKPRSRYAFTVTELLVVTAITMSLLGVVLTGARNSRSDGNIRHAAQQFASLLLASQSLSLSSPTGAAVIIDAQGRLGETIAPARRFPFIEGTVQQGMPPANLTAVTQAVTLSVTNDDDPSVLVHGYKIRFLDRNGGSDGPVSDWFALQCTAPPTATVSLRVDNGQTSRKALWPTTPAAGKLSFQASRYPIPMGTSHALPEGVAIDLRHSGYGDEGLVEWATLEGKGAIAVGFDPVGAVDSLMQNVLPASGVLRTVQPITPHEQIYFFVTHRSEIEDPAANALASTEAVWVVLHPRTGRVKISPNVPQSADDAAALRAARAKARQGIGIGG